MTTDASLAPEYTQPAVGSGLVSLCRWDSTSRVTILVQAWIMDLLKRYTNPVSDTEPTTLFHEGILGTRAFRSNENGVVGADCTSSNRG